MTFILAAVPGGLAILAPAIAGLLVQRRALRESVEQFRVRADQVFLGRSGGPWVGSAVPRSSSTKELEACTFE